MTRLRVTLLILAVSLAGLMGLTACGASESAPTPAVPAQPAEDNDLPDCDAEDRRKKEVPDCGFRSGGKFHWWSWAAQGKTTAPHDWRPDAEQRAAAGKTPPTPRGTTGAPRATTPKPARTSTRRATSGPR